MRFCEVTVILDDKQEERLQKLAERFKKINGWKEDDIMQFVVNGMSANVERQTLCNQFPSLQKGHFLHKRCALTLK